MKDAYGRRKGENFLVAYESKKGRFVMAGESLDIDNGVFLDDLRSAWRRRSALVSGAVLCRARFEPDLFTVEQKRSCIGCKDSSSLKSPDESF